MDVLHCDIRPANILITSSLELKLCDFGGSRFGNLYGRGLPNAGFYDPRQKDHVSTLTDIFSLGSTLYTLMRGFLPHCNKVLKTFLDADRYEALVQKRFSAGDFPQLESTPAAHVIRACWNTEIRAEQAFRSLRTFQSES